MSVNVMSESNAPSSALKAIETVYRGIRFRSRLEARWAVFFDTLGIPYEYEREGYDLGGTMYLPDFWLPKQDCYIEIKGSPPTDAEREKASLLASHSGKNVYLFSGQIPEVVGWFQDLFFEKDAYGYEVFFPLGGVDAPHVWCVCEYCGSYGIEFQGRSARLGCCTDNMSDHDDTGWSPDVPALKEAYAAARIARFEHGDLLKTELAARMAYWKRPEVVIPPGSTVTLRYNCHGMTVVVSLTEKLRELLADLKAL
jgi:hypothetical protein